MGTEAQAGQLAPCPAETHFVPSVQTNADMPWGRPVGAAGDSAVESWRVTHAELEAQVPLTGPVIWAGTETSVGFFGKTEHSENRASGL